MEGQNIVPDVITHALSTSLILENIFEFSEAGDVKSFRLVNKSWRDVASAPLGRSSLVRLSGLDPITRFRDFVASRNPDASRNLFVNFIMSFNLREHQSAVNLLETIGPNIKFLLLVNCEFPCVDALRFILFESCPRMMQFGAKYIVVRNSPEVEEPSEFVEPQSRINWNMKHFAICQRPKKLGLTWMEILCHFPCIEGLGFPLEGRRSNALKAVQLIRSRHENVLNLRQICSASGKDLLVPLNSPGVLRLFLNPGAKLKYIPIKLSPEYFGELVLKAIFSAQMNSMNGCEIALMRKPYLDPTSCFAQPLQNLTVLQLKARVFKSLLFVRFLPNLVTLSIHHDTGFDSDPKVNIVAGTDFGELVDVKLEKCLDFDIDIPVTVEQLLNLVKLFPNFTNLKMTLGTLEFEVVCKFWKNLVSLSVPDCKLDDFGIIGLDEGDSNWTRIKMGDYSLIRDTETWPNITDLKHLRQLRLYSQKSIFIPLPYHAAVYAIHQMPSLLSIEIHDYQVYYPFTFNHNGSKCPQWTGGNENRGYKARFTWNRRVHGSEPHMQLEESQ